MRLSLALLCAGICFGQDFFSVPPADAPQLASRGPFRVGVRTLTVTHVGQPDILHLDKQTGRAPLYSRSLPLEIWYPANLPPGSKEETIYQFPLSDRTVPLSGKAARDAEPVHPAQPFPLVIVSHGYPGSRFFLSYLTENLASKGYVVVAIDHTDSVTGTVQAFSSTLLNRSTDQWFVIHEIARMAAQPSGFLTKVVDANRTAIVGYSMGGYGALTSAGAGYRADTPIRDFVGGHYLDPLLHDNPEFRALDRSALKCVVAIAPWGEQPPYRAWSKEALASIRVPSLFITGDQDDVADYRNGIRPAFDDATGSQRYLLVYENARHNTGGNPPPPGIALDYRLRQSFDEPVWRKDRITAVNQHFITAFLDVYLKGDSSQRHFLEIPTTRSTDGRWTVPPNTPDDGTFSSGHDDRNEQFWPGFQRRWAIGLEWFEKPPDGQPGQLSKLPGSR